MSQIPYLPQAEASVAIGQMFLHLADWPIRSAEAFRNACLGDTGMLAINPLLEITEDVQVNFLRHLIAQTVAEGRMIDFGYVPNAIIKQESVRSRHMYEAGELSHPYDCWLGLSSWEGGHNGYLICPHPGYPGETLVIELYGISWPQVADAVLVYDLVSIKVNGPHDTMVTPAHMRYPPGHTETQQELRNRGSNSLDPLVTMLRLLADAAIPVSHVPEPVQLNKARAKKGKHPIPAHSVVHTKDYVSAFTTHQPTPRLSQGGHHASPIAHWRRGHLRQLASGKTVPVKSSKVNWRDTEELHRLFYRVDK